DTAPTAIYPLSLHDALPISTCMGNSRPGGHNSGRRPVSRGQRHHRRQAGRLYPDPGGGAAIAAAPAARTAAAQQPVETAAALPRSEEHTSELQSREISYAVF